MSILDYFDRVWFLGVAIVLAVAAAIAVLLTYRRRRARMAKFGNPDIVSRLAPPMSPSVGRVRALLLGLAALFAGVAAAGPRWGVEQTVVRGEGIDMVLALDASLSMMATDVRPNRLERLKQEVRRLRSTGSGDRVGVIAFAGRSYILTPLTIDNGALDLYLENLDPSVVGQAGSALSRAIRQGTALLRSTQSGADRALVIMSDGESHEPVEEITAAAQQAAEQGIHLVTVGFGTEQGGRIPAQAADGGDWHRDQDGTIVTTRYLPDLLRAAAEAAEGTFIEASETDKAGRIRSALSSLRTQRRAAAAGEERTPRFQLFLIPALLLLLLDTHLAERRARRQRTVGAAMAAGDRPGDTTPRATGPAANRPIPPSPSGAPVPARSSKRAAAASMSLLLVLLAGCTSTADRAARAYRNEQYTQAVALYRQVMAQGDRSPRTLYNFGTALVAADSIESAVEVLSRVQQSEDPELRFRATFNLGLAHLIEGLRAEGDASGPALDSALAVYRRSLRLRTDDGDAKWNYELALREQDEQSGGGGGGGGQEQTPDAQPDPGGDPQQTETPAGDLGQQQAERILEAAARDEQSVQARSQRQNRPTPPPGGKDW